MRVALEDEDGNEISTLEGLPQPIHRLIDNLDFATEHPAIDGKLQQIIESCFKVCQIKLDREKSEYSVEHGLGWDVIKIIVFKPEKT